MKRLPIGCDQQGRYPEAAEAATEIGADNPPEHDMFRVIAEDLLWAMVAIAAVAAVVLIVWGAA